MQRPSEYVRNPRESRTRRARSGIALALLLAVASIVPVMAQSSPDADARQVGVEIEERFDVMVLRSGVLLTPIEEEEGLAGIEIGDDGIALDGRLVEESELRARLGDVDADLVLGLLALETEVRREIFLEEAAQPIVEAVAEEESAMAVEEAEALEEDAEAIAAGRAERDEKKAERDKKKAERRHRRKSHSDSKVVVGERVVVERDESYGEVIVFGNNLEIYGEVRGDAVAIGGSVRVDGGEVTGSVSAIGGSIELENGAKVMGEAVSVGGSVDLGDDVEVRGDVVEVPFVPSLHFGSWGSGWDRGRWDGDADFFDFSPFRLVTRAAWKFFGLVLLALMACLVMLLARGPLERVERRVVAEPWKSGLVGLVAQVLFVPFLVLVVVVLAISIIGIPLLLLVPFAILALVVVAFLGYSAVAFQVGKFFESRVGWRLDSPYLILIVGVVLIEIFCLIGDLLDFGWVWFFAAMFTVFGVLIEYVVWTIGFGAALLTRFGTSDGWGAASRGDLPPVPPPTGGPGEVVGLQSPVVDERGFFEEALIAEEAVELEEPAADWASDSIFEEDNGAGSGPGEPSEAFVPDPPIEPADEPTEEPTDEPTEDGAGEESGSEEPEKNE